MVYTHPMIRTQIYLPQSQLQQLKQTAFEERTSVSEIIRRKLTTPSTKKTATKKSKMTIGKRLLAMAKDAERRGVKGPKDLSKNMDKYLYGAI